MARILHISTRLILGGSQENTVLTCEEQARRGHEVHLAFGPIYGPEGSLLDRVRAFRRSDGCGITTHEVKNLVRELSPQRDTACVAELRRLIAGLRPHVVHTHSSKAGVVGRIAAWQELHHRSRTRLWDGVVLHTIHGPPFMPVEGGVLARARTRFLNWTYTLAERRAAQHCDAIVSVADAMTQQFLARGIGRPEQYTTVRSGMEVEQFLHASPGEDRESVRESLGLLRDDFVIGTVARLAQHKGHDDILTALGEDLRAHPSWKLLWVGDGWWRERLEQRARSMGLSGSLVLTGLVPPDRVAGLMRAMDVLVHPSSREGLPRTVPQALLAGTLPIAYDCDGTREVCVEMQTGRLVPVGDVATLREAVRWAQSHAVERAAMVARGRERCAREFSVAAMVDGLDDVIARVRSGVTARASTSVR